VHEAGLMKGLIRQIESIAEAEGGARIVAVSVWLGALSQMSPAHFEEHFRQAAKGARAEGARINATVSTDPGHQHAMDVILESVEVEV
jgi:hydrogenase nickel incorporation protein HypA/HybF